PSARGRGTGSTSTTESRRPLASPNEQAAESWGSPPLQVTSGAIRFSVAGTRPDRGLESARKSVTRRLPDWSVRRHSEEERGPTVPALPVVMRGANSSARSRWRPVGAVFAARLRKPLYLALLMTGHEGRPCGSPVVLGGTSWAWGPVEA